MYSIELQEKIKRIEINIEKTTQIYEQRKKQKLILSKEESIWMEMLKLKNDECSSEKLRLHQEQDNLWKGRSKFLNDITLSLEKISPKKQILKLTQLNDSILNGNAIGGNISNSDSINNDFKCEQIKEKTKNLQVKIEAANIRIKELQYNEYNADNAIKADDCYQTIHSTILQILEKIDKNEDNIKDITSNILKQKYVHFQKECSASAVNIFSNEISSTQIDSTLYNNSNVYHADEDKFSTTNKSQLSYDGLPLNDTLKFDVNQIKGTENNESVSIKLENSFNENSFTTIIDDKMCDEMHGNIRENETIIAVEYEKQLNTLFQNSNNSGFITAAEIFAISSEPITKKKFVYKKQTNH